MTAFAQTGKQLEIMGLVLAAADLGKPIKFSELCAQLSYKPSKQAVMCSVKFLVRHGFLTRERKVWGKKGDSTLISPTPLAFVTFRGPPTPPEALSV